VQGGEGDEVGFVVLLECEEGVAELFDVNAAGERGFLGVVALEADAVLLVGYTVRCDGRVVAV